MWTVIEDTHSMVADAVELGALIRRMRLASGLSQEQLAERSGLSVRAVSDLERGQRSTPRPETIRMLADGMQLGRDERQELLLAARPDLRLSSKFRASRRSVEHGLPEPATRLIGRDREVAELIPHLKRGDRRLTTLTGPGGVGKTRLAVEAANLAAPAFSDGVVFVDLSPVTVPQQVASAIAQAIGIQQLGEQAIRETLRTALSDRHILLVLDNFEHVIDAAAMVGDLIAGSPELRMLVTSREALRIRAEAEYIVEPLEFPAEQDAPSLDQLWESPAIELFVAAAASVKTGFELSEENAGTVAAICRRVDGLPLAIELAASRVRHFPPAVLLERLGQRLPVLTGGPRDLPARQQTLRDTIAWSYDLLTSDEQALFRRLGAFPGGAPLAALDTYATFAEPLAIDLLSGLASLVDKSLVRERIGADGLPRFSMLETIREFAGERSVELAEVDVNRSAIVAWALRFAGSYTSEVFGLLQRPADRRRVDEELDNLRLGFEIAAERHDAEACTQLFVEVVDQFYQGGLFEEGTAMGLKALALGETNPVAPLLRGRALSDFSSFWNTVHDAAGAEQYARDGLALIQVSARDSLHTVGALSLLVMTVRDQGRLAEALAYAEQADSLAVSLGAESHLTLTKYEIGRLSYLIGDQDRAVEYLEESLRRCLPYGANFLAFHAANSLASAQTRRGDLPEAASYLRLAVNLWEETDGFGAGGFLDEAALLAAASGRPDISATLFGADAAQIALFGMRDDYDRWTLELLEDVRRQLGAEAYKRSESIGRSLDMKEATALVLRLLDEIEAQE